MTQSVGPAPATLQRPDYANSLSMAQLPVAPEEKTGDGALFPAVVLGVGAVGGRVVRRLRRAMAGRFGGPDATPHLRLLALDTDPAAVNDHSGEGRHLLLARLNRPTHYLTKARDGAVLDWLDPHLLYRMPRNPVTTGLRGLGRLALWDHARAIENRLRVELEAVLEPAALADADKHTGLGLRTNRPRVYVVANLAGGTGGGMFLDLAYLARHALRRLGYARPEVVGVLLLPPADRTAKSPALANAYAALAELHHFSRPESLYELRLSAREPPVVDGDRPFARCLVLPLPGVADEASQRQTAGLVAGLLLRELLAPLGRVADEARAAATKPGDHLAFCHTAAAYRLSAPRRRLTRHAGLRLSEHLLRQWTAKEATALRAPVGAWLDEQWEARQIRPELVIDRVHELCRAAVGQDPDTKFDALVAPLAERGALGTKLDARSACQVLDDLVELVGKPAEADADGAQQGLLRQAVERSLQALSAEYDQKLAEMAVHFIELPQYRLAGADETIRQLGERLRQVLATYEGMSKGLSREAADYYARLMGLLGALDAAGGRRNANATAGEVMELLRAYPRKRYQALVAGFALSIYRSMLNTAPEYLREVNFCRQRLGEVLAALEQAVATEADRRTPLGPSLEVYPGGARTLDEAAGQLIALLTPEDLLDLDGRVQQQVRRQFRAVVNYCLESNGPTGPLVELLTQQAEEFLTAKLGEAGSADVFFQHFAADPQAAQRAIAQAYQEAEPELAAARAGRGAELTVLAVPAGTAGDHLRVLAEQTLAGVTLRPAHSPDDVVFYRELHGLALTDLPQLGPQARDAYQQALETDHPPHSRKDVVWQLPVRNSTA